MNDPTVSVIIPAYRAAHTIHRPIESLLVQTRLPDEIVVIDDGSPDNLAEALTRYGDRVNLVRQSNGGAASARNLGIETSRGELVAFLDADDYWEPSKLERQLDTLRTFPKVGLVASRYYNQVPGCARTGPNPQLEEKNIGHVMICNAEKAFEMAMNVWTSTVLVRRTTLGAHRFVSGLEPAEDRDLWVRLINSAPMFLDEEPLATWVLEPGSLSRSNIDVGYGNMLRVVHRYPHLLGPRARRFWEAHTLGGWACAHLARGRPGDAVKYALARLRLQPHSVRGWWTLVKSAAIVLVSNPSEGARKQTGGLTHDFPDP